MASTPTVLPVVEVIIGPTASGKSALALQMAALNPSIEIISADSRQIYTGLDIGTAKPSAEEQRAVRHHLIDIRTANQPYSAGQFTVEARACIADVLARGGVPIVVGGSGFYIRALFEGLDAQEADSTITARLEERLREEGGEPLYEELVRVDPAAAAAHSANNHVKTLRALSSFYQTGKLYSERPATPALGAAPYKPQYIGIAPPRAELYARINNRVLAMLDAGLLAETQATLAAGYTATDPGLRTVGYAEAIRHLKGELSYGEMVAAIQQSTRRYAKRQMTWFRRVEGFEAGGS